jgi:hypothetical protein
MRPVAEGLILRLAATAQSRLIPLPGIAAAPGPDGHIPGEQEWAVGSGRYLELTASASAFGAALADGTAVPKARPLVAVIAKRLVCGKGVSM